MRPQLSGILLHVNDQSGKALLPLKTPAAKAIVPLRRSMQASIQE